MNNGLLRALLLAGSIAPAPWITPVAQAALGAAAAGIAAEAAAVRGAEAVTTTQFFDIHVISTDDGLRISQYADHNGIVFAVTWAGPVVPDLRRLLGDSYPGFAAAVAARSPAVPQRALRVVTADLVVEHSGHMRAFSGRAWLPARLPAGVAVADVR